MKQKNVTVTLLDRERGNKQVLPSLILKKYLEEKTAQNHIYQKTYDTASDVRSTFVITFSSDRTLVATSHGNHTVKISNCYTCKVIHTLNGHSRTPWSISFHPKVNYILASGCLGGQVRLWDLKNFKDDNLIFKSSSGIASLTFDPTGYILLIATENVLILFDWNQIQVLKTIRTKHHSEHTRLIKFLPYGDRLITGTTNAPDTEHTKPTCLDVGTLGEPNADQPLTTLNYVRMRKRSVDETKGERKQHFTLSKKSKTKMNQEISTPLTIKRSAKDSSCQTDFKDHDRLPGYSTFSHEGTMVSKAESNDASVPLSTTTISHRSHKDSSIYSDSSVCSTSVVCLGVVARASSSIKSDESKKTVLSGSNNQSKNLTQSSAIDVRCSLNSATSNIITNEILRTESNHNTHADLYSEAQRHRDNMRRVVRQGIELPTSTRSEREYISCSEQRPTRGKPAVSTIENLRHEEEDTKDPRPVLSNFQSSDGNTPGKRVRSEIYNLKLADAAADLKQSSSNVIAAFDTTKNETSTNCVHGFNSFSTHAESSGRSPSISNVDTRCAKTNEVATATSRSCRHIHTAVVIASQEDHQSETIVHSTVNHTIAGALARSVEGAVATDIIQKTHRLQLWSYNEVRDLDITNEVDNVVVPFCKIHNDASVDISQDGTLIAAFIPSSNGFLNDGQLEVISLQPESYLQCIYSRKYGPNAISVSFSPFNQFICVGLASRKLHWHATSQQLVAQILEMPCDETPVYEDCAKPISNILHKSHQNTSSTISVNNVCFHPLPGMGIYYGTNRGHIQHCQFGYSWARKIKETIHSIKDENHINNISYTLPDIWLPSLRKDQRAQDMKATD